MNATRRTSILGCTFLASVLGCDRPSVPSAVTLRDSSGVRITEIDWEAVPEGSALVQKEELSAGALLELHEVRDAIRLSDGSVVIVEASTQEAIWLGSDGELIRRIGGRGDGPEQFRGLSRVFEADDADLILLDSTRKRYVRLDREGGIVEGGQGPVTIAAIFTGHHTADGEWYLLTSGPMEETGIARNSGSDQVAIVRRPRLALIRARFDGSGAVDSITTILGTESAIGPASMGILGFGATAVSAGGREGVWIGDTGVAEVKLWTTQEGPARIVRWKETNSRAVDESVTDALWLDLAALTSPEELEGIRAVLRSVRRSRHSRAW